MAKKFMGEAAAKAILAKIKQTDTVVGTLPTEARVNDLIKAKVGNGKGLPNGVASLDANMKVPASQLPAYVDDVLEFAGTLSTKPTISQSSTSSTNGTVVFCSATNTFIYKDGTTYYSNWAEAYGFGSASEQGMNGYTPAKGKIYVDTTTNKQYRWSGSAMTEISKSLAIGTTAGTAYDGGAGATLRTEVTALNTFKKTKDQANGLCPLDANKYVPDARLNISEITASEINTWFASVAAASEE
ncbi:MAG: hypothetical protein K1V78_09565 [Muribaculaceae bacterium]